MKIKLFFLFVSVSFLLNAQSTKNAPDAIKELKSGVLIINLIHPTKKIAALLQSGQKEESLALENEVAAEHTKMIAAFKANYSFSTLLFVYSYDMGKLADGDAGVLFNSLGEAQTNIPEHFYFVEYTLSKRNLSGLLVKDNQRDTLENPFPYFVALYSGLGFGKRSFAELAKVLNRRLTDYYEFVNQ